MMHGLLPDHFAILLGFSVIFCLWGLLSHNWRTFVHLHIINLVRHLVVIMVVVLVLVLNGVLVLTLVILMVLHLVVVLAI